MAKKLDRRALFWDGVGKPPLGPEPAPFVRTDTVGSTSATAASLPASGVATGVIDVAGDFDWWRVELTAGFVYAIDLRGADGPSGRLADPYLRVRDADGAEIDFDDDSGSGLNARLLFTPARSGVHFLDAGAYGPETGAFRLSVAVRDIAAGTSTLARIAPGESYGGEIGRPGDADWYRITLTAGRDYRFDLRGAGSGGGDLADPLLRLMDARGRQIALDDDGGAGTDARLVFRPTTSGVFHLAAEGFDGATGDFTLSVAEVDLAATTATRGRVAVDGSARSVIDRPGDVDWFAVTLRAGETYRITQQGADAGGGPLEDPFIRGVHRADGRLIADTENDDYGGALEPQVTFRATTSGRHFVAAGAFGDLTGGYQVRVDRIGTADAEGDDPASAGRIAVGDTVVGAIDTARDIDWRRVALEAGVTYAVDLRGASTEAGTLTDPYFVGVYASNGRLVPGTGDDDGGEGLDSRTVFTPDRSGNYFLAAGGYFNDTGTYRLSIAAATASGDTPANVLSDAQVAVGGRHAGAIETGGDVDWVGVTLAAGATYRIDLIGAGGGGTLADPEIVALHRADGSVVAGVSDDNSGAELNARVSFTAPTAGRYFVAVAAHDDGVGTYSLRVAAADDAAAPRVVSVTPTDGATGVAVSANLTLTFDEAVRAGGGEYLLTGGGRTIRIDGSDTRQVSVSGETVTLNPTADLRPNTAYTLTWQRGAATDLAGNPLAAQGSTTAWNFRTAAAGAGPGDSWTVMVYVAGDNNLESFALSDMNEMESVRLPADLNVVTLVDRAPGYATGSGDWTDTREGRVVFDGTNPTVGTLAASTTSIGERNTGDGATLTGFIDRAVRANPADNYALILWDHGGGTSGVAWDDSAAADNLTLRELRAAIDASILPRFDLIGFDACLMGMVEQASDLRGLADVMVASEELEPGDGWDYAAFLRALAADPTMSAEQLAGSIVSTYAAFYQGQNDITLSATRIAGVAALERALDAFVDRALRLAPTGADWRGLREAADRARQMPSDDSYDFADLGDFMGEVVNSVGDAALKARARDVAAALDRAVFAEAGTVGEATGLAIYLPFGDERVDPDYSAANFTMLSRVDWDDFLAVL